MQNSTNNHQSDRPEVGANYLNLEGDTVEVRAVSSSHVVCCGERSYTRADFERFFLSGDPNGEPVA